MDDLEVRDLVWAQVQLFVGKSWMRDIWKKERGRKEKQDREGMGNIYKVDTATEKKTDG